MALSLVTTLMESEKKLKVIIFTTLQPLMALQSIPTAKEIFRLTVPETQVLRFVIN